MLCVFILNKSKMKFVYDVILLYQVLLFLCRIVIIRIPFDISLLYITCLEITPVKSLIRSNRVDPCYFYDINSVFPTVMKCALPTGGPTYVNRIYDIVFNQNLLLTKKGFKAYTDAPKEQLWGKLHLDYF